MKVLVTGAAGGIGRSLVPRLRRAGHEVVATSRPRQGHPAPTSENTEPLDILNRAAIGVLLRRVRPVAIVHLAGMVGPACEADPARVELANVTATADLAAEATAVGVSRIVFASTAAAYGDTHNIPVDEWATLDGRSAYAASKVRAEKVLMDASSRVGSPSSVSLRIFNVFGPAFPQSLVERLRLSTPESPVTLIGQDHFIRDWIHVDRVCDAIASALGADVSVIEPGKSFVAINVGSGRPIDNRSLVAILAEIAPVWTTVVGDSHSFSCADLGLSERLLGLGVVDAFARDDGEAGREVG